MVTLQMYILSSIILRLKITGVKAIANEFEGTSDEVRSCAKDLLKAY